MHIIGDVHGKIDSYNKITSKLDQSIQLGDMSLEYSKIRADPANHKFFGGNHDNYDTIHYSPNWIGERFGIGFDSFFYVEGAFSIDVVERQMERRHTGRKTWWGREELTLQECQLCLSFYKEVKPSIVITHTCPLSVEPLVGDGGVLQAWGWADYVQKTPELLQMMLDCHRPDLWVFGHFHKSWRKYVGGTEFVCLNELEVIEI